MSKPAPQAIVPYNQSFFFVNLECDYYGSQVTSNGVFRNHNPLDQPLPWLLVMLGVAILLLAIVKRLVRPLRQPRFVAEMLVGMLLGPSTFRLIGKEDFYVTLFNQKKSNMLNALELVGFAYFSFIVGVRTDLGVVKASGKLSWMTGLGSFLIPLVLILSGYQLVRKNDFFLDTTLYWIAVRAASSSFQVTSFLLEDLKLLNSEIGRLALSSSLISSLGSWLFGIYHTFLTYSLHFKLSTIVCVLSEVVRIVFVVVVIFVLRPCMFWMMRKIPEGRNIKEQHFFTMIMMLMAAGYLTEILGLEVFFGAMILGLAVPPGPPLGSGIVNKLEVWVTGVLLPVYIFNAGRYIDVYGISWKHFSLAETLIILAYLGKLVSALIPWLVGGIPASDSLTLGLILSSQGFYDVLFFKLYYNYTLLTQEFYSIIAVMALVYAAVVTPLISYLYDPSKRYVNYKKRTIQQSNMDRNELQILTCVHEEYDVLSLMNALRAANPTRERPVGVFVLDLMELVGREHPVFINHQFHRRSSFSHSRTNRIINAFNQYEFQHEGMMKRQHYTMITPYATMHDDICMLALQRNASLMIIPFHKSDTVALKGVTKHLLEKAPCSVGLLFDKKIIMHWGSNSQRQSMLRICVIFVGGPDSREALAFGMRIAGNPSFRLNVIRLIAEDEFISDMNESKLDLKAITELKYLCEVNHNVEYREEIVKDGIETSQVIMSIEDIYDFILVGRRLEAECPLVQGLSDWTYIEELGIIGDIVASSDMKCNASVLVLQQQTTVEDLKHRA